MCAKPEPVDTSLFTCDSGLNGRIITSIYLNELQPEKEKMFEPANYPETRAERRKRERIKNKKS